MPRLEPDHRAVAVLAAVAEAGRTDFRSDNPLETSLFHLVKTGHVTQRDVEEAFALYVTPQFRHALNALLLAKCELSLLTEGMELSALVVAAYKHLFFDRNVFRHVLDIIAWVNSLRIDPELHRYYVIANQQGPATLIDEFRIGDRPEIDPKLILNQVMNDQYRRFLEHRGQSIDSPVAQAALRAGREATMTAVLLIDKGGGQIKHALEDLKGALTLQTKDQTFSPEAANIDLKTIVG